MSQATSPGANATRRLDEIPVSDIGPNDGNPRLHFPEEQMDRLRESIALAGILVPVVVYQDAGGYVLLDGERRWRCAQELGLDKVPAIIVEPPKSPDGLLQMFNIHMVREAWQDMPTAWALERLISTTGIEGDRDLADRTGLSVERIKRLRHALELPKEYQDYINEDRVPLNFFWELKRNVIEPLAQLRPSLWAEFEQGQVLSAFVDKRLAGTISDVIALRNVRPIITYAANDVENSSDSSPLDDTLRNLIKNPEMTIDEAYEDTVQVVVEADKLERRATNTVRSFERLMGKAHDEAERGYIRKIASTLIEGLRKVIV
jgi:ParB family transcriptional regulator, chromosome partitioning protein